MYLRLLMLPLLSTLLFADLTITTLSDETTETTYYKNGLMATVSLDNKTIFNTKERTITIISNRHKIYVQESLDDYLKSLINTEAEHQEQFQSYPVTAVQLQEAATPLIKKTGTATVAGYSCDTYEVTNTTDKTIEESCLSKEVEALIEKEVDAAVMKELSKEMAAFEEESGSDPLEEKGYCLRTIDMTYGNSGVTSVVTSISTKPIDAALLAIPKGYKKVQLAELYSFMMQ